MFLLKRFNNDDDAYRIFNQTEMLSTVSEVTSRTREIGIRKSIGAKRKDILVQFLLESSVLSGVGGLIGVIFGIVGSSLLTKSAGINTKIDPMILIISFSFSIAVGMFFGIYPANKASKLKPVDALRFE